MQISSSAAGYLVAIYELAQKNDCVRAIDIAHYLDFSKPSVSRAVAGLKTEEYITVQDTGEIALTVSGLSAAKNIGEKQAVLEKLLLSAGVPQGLAKSDAALMKYVLSDETLGALQKIKETKEPWAPELLKEPKEEKEKDKPKKDKDKDKKKKKKK